MNMKPPESILPIKLSEEETRGHELGTKAICEKMTTGSVSVICPKCGKVPEVQIIGKYLERVIPLLGNHEAMCLNYYRYKEQSKKFMQDNLDYELAHALLDNDGDETKRQFKKLKRLELQQRLRLMRRLSNHYQVDRFYFCHAGIQPYIPLDKQREGDLLWMREGFFELYDGRAGTIVIGRTPVQELKRKHWIDGQTPTTPQFLQNNIIMCDTGAFMEGGKLSCVDVLTGKFWQV